MAPPRSEPVVTYMETVSVPSTIECVGKSPNNLNRVTLTCQPLTTELTTDLEKKLVPEDEKERSVALRTHGWDPSTYPNKIVPSFSVSTRMFI